MVHNAPSNQAPTLRQFQDRLPTEESCLDHHGELITRVVTRTKEAMHGVILSHVLPGTTVNTDEFGGYKEIDQAGYRHVKVTTALANMPSHAVRASIQSS